MKTALRCFDRLSNLGLRDLLIHLFKKTVNCYKTIIIFVGKSKNQLR